jgi:hypothetical protein
MANPVTYRMWVPNRQHQADLHFNSPTITVGSVVHISVSQATDLETANIIAAGGRQRQTFTHHFGSAPITLQNVSVRNGGVDFRVYVAWDDYPLNLVTDITVFDPPTEIIIGT